MHFQAHSCTRVIRWCIRSSRLSQSLSCHSGSVRSYSMNSLLDSEHSEAKSYGDVPVPAPASRRASVDVRTISPLTDKKLEAQMETKPPPPPPPPPPPFSQNLRRGSADFRSVSPLPDRRSDATLDAQVVFLLFFISVPFVLHVLIHFCFSFFFFQKLSPMGAAENPPFPR